MRAFLPLLVGLVLCNCSEPAAEPDALNQDADDGAGDGAAGFFDADAPDNSGPCKQIIDFGTIETGTDGKTAKRTFQLPSGSRSFVIAVTGDPDTSYNLAELTLANSISLVPKAWVSLAGQPVACIAQCTNRVLAQRGAAAFLFPNTPLAKLPPGAVTFRVIAFYKDAKSRYPPATGKVNVRVHTVCATDNNVPATLALNIGLTGAGGLSKESALQDPRLSKAIAIVKSVYGKAGVSIDPVRVFKAAEIPFIAQQDGEKAELTTLFRSGSAAEMGVNIMLVDKIVASGQTGPGESLLAGISGGIPGPPLEVGGDRSGIAVALHLAPGQQDVLGHTIAHELGHFLGLFHTVEVPPAGGSSITDNINDTDDSNTNLMHWTVSEAADKLTSGQRFVLGGSPWLVRSTD